MGSRTQGVAARLACSAALPSYSKAGANVAAPILLEASKAPTRVSLVSRWFDGIWGTGIGEPPKDPVDTRARQACDSSNLSDRLTHAVHFNDGGLLCVADLPS